MLDRSDHYTVSCLGEFEITVPPLTSTGASGVKIKGEFHLL